MEWALFLGIAVVGIVAVSVLIQWWLRTIEDNQKTGKHRAESRGRSYQNERR